jgi:hypothetical protein
MADETQPPLEVEVTEETEQTPEQVEAQPEEPKMFYPDKTPIPDGPLKGLPAWVRDIKTMFLGYGQQIAQLTSLKQEFEYIFGEITQTIILLLPEEIGDNESPHECIIRLLTEYAHLKDQLEPMALRLAAAENELEQLKKEKSDGVPSGSDPGTVPTSEG